VSPLKIKIPSKNIGRQRCAEGFDSGVKRFNQNLIMSGCVWSLIFNEITTMYGCDVPFIVLARKRRDGQLKDRICFPDFIGSYFLRESVFFISEFWAPNRGVDHCSLLERYVMCRAADSHRRFCKVHCHFFWITYTVTYICDVCRHNFEMIPHLL
jgi:hypothetical protein